MQKRNSFVQKSLIIALCAGVGLLTSCSKLQSRDQLNQGVQAYKAGHYNDAVTHFKQAVTLDPTSQNAQLYLATSYYIQWVPGAENPDNLKNHDMAAQEFEDVLKKDPNNPLALAMMASMSYNAAQAGTADQKAKALEEAKQWNLKRIEANPKEAEPYYYLGVIDWAKAYAPIQTARVELKMVSTEPGPIKDAKVRADLKDKYSQAIDDGIVNLRKCLDIDKENEDAMTYLNLLLRKKADLEDSPDAAKADIAQAEEFANRALDTKRIKATRPAKKEEAS
jgi:tetratricopeptide (TPR) repeat protein